MPKIDKQAYYERIQRMSEIFGDMVQHADEQSLTRCPYRDRHDHCTAHIRCNHQARPASGEGPATCTHDGRFDYRSAWDSDPDSRARARKKIDRYRKRKHSGSRPEPDTPNGE